MDMSIMRELTSDQLKNDIPDFNPGDRLRIHVRVIEGEKERLQVFEGDVIQRKGSGIQETVTVRKVTQGIAVERIFPVHSPRVSQIENIRRGKVRRAKLYYLRSRRGKRARIAEKVERRPEPGAPAAAEPAETDGE